MWNYRVIKREVKDQSDEFGLFEVFYNDEGEIFAHAESAEIYGDSLEDIIKTLEQMLKDAKKNQEDSELILKMNEIKFAPLYDENEKLEAFDVRDLINDTNNTDSFNIPPLSWTDSVEGVDEQDYHD